MTSAFSPRRVGAVFLPTLSCELVSRYQESKSLPLGVVEAERKLRLSEELELGNVLTAVNDAAYRFGVRAGQTVAQARSRVANLSIRGLTGQGLRQALGRVAEVALALGPTVSIDPGNGSKPLDTVWVDLTGSAHLWGGEEATLLEMSSRIRELGHRVRTAIADGPRLARAACAYTTASETIVPFGRGKDMMQSLPLDALPLPRDRIVWLNRLGLWTVSDLTKLPVESWAGRLGAAGSPPGEGWREALELSQGRDDAPLISYEPPRAPCENITWDDPILSIFPLLFALSNVVSRLSARLEGRGEAAQSLQLFLPYDRSIAKLKEVAVAEGTEPGLFFRIDLPSPLAKKGDLFRVLKTKLEHTELAAPVTGLSLTAGRLTRAPRVQLLLDGDRSISTDPRAMAVLLAELSAEIGPENVGVIELDGVHRPEARTKLVPLDKLSPLCDAVCRAASDAEFPTRLLPTPIPLAVVPGSRPTVAIDNHLYTVAGASQSVRFDQVEWWTASPFSRDYMRVWLTSGKKNVEAWVFTDRCTGQTFLHGYYD